MRHPPGLSKWSLAITFVAICSLESAAQPATGVAQSETPGGTDTSVSGQPQPEITSSASTPVSQSSVPRSGSKAKANKESGDQKQTGGTSKDRLFFALPNFLTLENAGNVPPLTTAQKFKVTAQGSFDPVEYFWYGMLAGIGQAENSEARYGQGAEGYGKRYGTSIGDGTIENFTTEAIFPSLLHQDPRYFQMGKGGFWRRTGYAVSRIFVTRTDSGHNQFNYSEVFGSAVAAGISTYSYHPTGDRNLPNALSVWGTQVGYDALTYVVKEFWPDLRRKLRRPK